MSHAMSDPPSCGVRLGWLFLVGFAAARQGSQGPPGDPGAKDDTGPAGPAGPVGAMGPPGSTTFAGMTDRLTNGNVDDNTLSGAKADRRHHQRLEAGGRWRHRRQAGFRRGGQSLPPGSLDHRRQDGLPPGAVVLRPVPDAGARRGAHRPRQPVPGVAVGGLHVAAAPRLLRAAGPFVEEQHQLHRARLLGDRRGDGDGGVDRGSRFPSGGDCPAHHQLQPPRRSRLPPAASRRQRSRSACRATPARRCSSR